MLYASDVVEKDGKYYLYAYLVDALGCVLTGGCFITERNLFERPVTFITDGCVMGYKYFEFGDDYSSKIMKFVAKVRGLGAKSRIRILIDDPTNGEEIGTCEIGTGDGIYEGIVNKVTGRHSVYLVAEHGYDSMDFAMPGFETRHLFELDTFVLLKQFEAVIVTLSFMPHASWCSFSFHL